MNNENYKMKNIGEHKGKETWEDCAKYEYLENMF